MRTRRLGHPERAVTCVQLDDVDAPASGATKGDDRAQKRVAHDMRDM